MSLSDVKDPSEVLKGHHAGVGCQGVGHVVGLHRGVKVHPESGVALDLMVCNLWKSKRYFVWLYDFQEHDWPMVMAMVYAAREWRTH